MYESIPTAIIPPPPGRTPGNLTLKKKYHQIFDGAGETHCQIPNGAGKKHSQMPISASYVSHIILREQNQLDFKCLFNFIFTVKDSKRKYHHTSVPEIACEIAFETNSAKEQAITAFLTSLVEFQTLYSGIFIHKI